MWLFVDLWVDLGVVMAPLWASFVPLGSILRCPEVSRGKIEGFWNGLRRSRRDLGASCGELGASCVDTGGILGDFGSILDHLGRSCGHPGSSLGYARCHQRRFFKLVL